MISEDIKLFTDGMGIVIYSPKVMSSTEEGSDFLTDEFFEPSDVAAHIKAGDITGFCTGSGGEFNLKIREGYPDGDISEEYPVAIRLAIKVEDRKLSFIDLFWLSEWSNDIPEDQTITVDDGIYHLTVLTRQPESGIWGDDQDIYIYMNKLEEMPELRWEGVPMLFTE